MKDILYHGDEARDKLKAGVKKLHDAVCVTMGPGGRFVLLDGPGGIPNATKDGVTVAKAIQLVDPIENFGASLIRQTSEKTVSEVGDGTTTAAVLTQAIIDNSPKDIKNVTQFTKSLKQCMNDIIEELSNTKIAEPTRDQLYQAAFTSSNGDEQIAEQVTDTVLSVGIGGIIDAVLGHTSNTVCDITSGYKTNRGYESTMYINQADQGTFEREGSTYVLLLDGKLENFRLIKPILKHVKEQKGLLIVIAEDFSAEVQRNCLENFVKYGQSIIPIKSDEFGDRRRFNLEDLALYLNEGHVYTIADLKEDDVKVKLGTAAYIKISKDYTIFRRQEGSTNLIEERITQLKTLKKDSKNEFDRDKLKKRISQLSAGYAVIQVGADTQVEAQELLDRYEDAIGATHAAYIDGILPGGGIALVDAVQHLTSTTEESGYNTLLLACYAPLYKILENADKYQAYAESCIGRDDGVGINVVTGKEVNMVNEGIIDPYKVTVSALKSAVSIASIIISTGAVYQTPFVQQ